MRTLFWSLWEPQKMLSKERWDRDKDKMDRAVGRPQLQSRERRQDGLWRGGTGALVVQDVSLNPGAL